MFIDAKIMENGNITPHSLNHVNIYILLDFSMQKGWHLTSWSTLFLNKRIGMKVFSTFTTCREGRMRLGRKNKRLFCSSLNFHYLCPHI